MPLLDHFRPPLSERRHWHSFHNSWATTISSQLNAALPEGWFAEPNVQFGIEIDVAAFEESHRSSNVDWEAPPPNVNMPVNLSAAVVEIALFSRSGGPTLAGAIELVSPDNKDRPGQRDALVTKCASYLQAGVGVVLVDAVTVYPADLHRELLARVGAGDHAGGSPLSASAYRPVKRDGTVTLDVWYDPLTLDRPMPTLPLWLRGGICVPVELETTYERTCLEQRIRPAA